ncbi:hypothetical protein [Oerskovia turbata]
MTRVATVLMLVGAVLALPSAVLGLRAVHGLETRPWERRVGPLGAAAIGVAGIVLIVTALVGAIEVVADGVIGAPRPVLLLGVLGPALIALVLIAVGRARVGDRSRAAQIVVERARRSLALLLLGALLCGTAILLV